MKMNERVRGLSGKRLLLAAFVPAALASMAVGTAACSAAPEEEPEGGVGMMQSSLQLAWVGTTEGATNAGVNLVKESSQIRKGKSTGAIRAVIGSARASCGSTFISNRRGITAAHCLENYSTAQTFTVEQYNTQFLNIQKVVDQSTVQGTWPAWGRPVKLTSADGYQVTSYSCKVERRCLYNPVNCPAGATNSDLALFYCSARSTAAQAVKNWVDIPNADTFGSFLDVWWFHELLRLQIANSGYEMPYQPDFNWYHYGYYDNNMADNFHYTQSSTERHQLFPLRSTHSKQNVRYQSAFAPVPPPATPPLRTQTNVPVCHGTSGSGVFRYNTDELVGVVNTGRLQADGTSDVLCSDMNAVIGSSSMSYASTAYTKLFELPEVLAERN